MQQGMPIQHPIEGIGREGWSLYAPPGDWGSAGRLQGAAKMCHIDKYPDDPDGLMAFPLAGLTSVELLGHEMGHFWHASINFRKEDMTEDHTGLRGRENDSANQHWSGDFNSGPSVMYGADITDNGDGTFTYDPAKPRKYGNLDQYVMGLIPPEETGELFFLCSSSNIEDCREGNPSLPVAKTASPSTVDDKHKHIVTIEDIVRAMGERKPNYDDAQKHFNIGFILVNKPGTTPFPNQLERLEKIRTRYEEWFHWATDGRSTICTRLDGDCSGEQEVPDEEEKIDDFNEYPDENETYPDEDLIVEQPDEKENIPDETIEEEDPETDETGENKSDDEEEISYEDEVGCSCRLIY